MYSYDESIKKREGCAPKVESNMTFLSYHILYYINMTIFALYKKLTNE